MKKWIQLFLGLNTVSCKKNNDFFKSNYFLDQRSFYIVLSLSFFGTPVNNFGDMLFQVLSADRLGELSFDFSLIKV